MRLTAFILTACCLGAAAGTRSQSNITYTGKNVKLENVFQAVKQQTGYIFFYDNGVIAKTKPVTVDVKNLPLAEFMELVLRGQELTWLLENTTILIQKKKQEQKDEKKIEVKPNPVTGIVRGSDGQPLPGVNIMVKGTKRGTVTDNEGKFSITVDDENTVLIISATNIETREIKVDGRNDLSNIIVKMKVAELNEVVINKGYYTEKQKTSVSNVGKVTAAEIERQPVGNVLLALQGRVPGLFITQNSGISGGSIKVRIQGQNSIANGSNPLYVVDGVPIDAELPPTGLEFVLSPGGAGIGRGVPGNPLSYINPSDIESVEVLKDADATAIFGSRAANGAILITTKKGNAGVMKLDVDVQTGWGGVNRKLKMMNTRQYLDMRYEAFVNDGIDWTKPAISANDLKVWDTTRYTDWQDELIGGTAKYTNINASVSGGSSNMRYLVSGTYNKATTVFPLPSDFADQKAAVHFNVNAASNNQKMKMQFSGNYMFDDNQLPQFDLTQTALLLEPNAPSLLNADGSINWAPDAAGNSTFGVATNVMTYRYKKYVNKTHNLVSSLKLDYSILPGLSIGSSFGYNYMQTNDFWPSPLIVVAPELRATAQRSANFGNRNILSWIIEPQAGYRAKISKGTLDLLVGSTFQDNKSVSGNISGNGQLSDELLGNINSAVTVVSNNSAAAHYRYNALFGRAVYNWQDKYILSINARRDGSTRFGGDNRFHNFGSVGAAWVFSSEKFFNAYTGIVNFGKLRASFGTTGSDQIGDFKFMSLYNTSSVSAPYQGIAGIVPAGLPNHGLQWEETKKLQIGIDVGLFQDKLVLNTTYARNRSSNQLLNYILPTTAGFTSYFVNFPATIQNRNWEFLATGKMIQKKNLTWTSSVNLTIPQNKLIEFPGLANSTYSTSLIIGQPLDVLKPLHWVGVADGTGQYLYEANNGHLTISPDLANDLTRVISNYATLYGGFNNTITYKSVQLDFFFQFVKQTGYNDAAFWNGANYPGMFSPGVSNQPVTLLNRWQKPGDKATVAKYSTSQDQYILESDRRFSDASYISLKNISLSWELPKKWVNGADFRNFRIYMHGQNLLIITKYKGLSPETQSMTSLPPLRIWTAGVQLGL